MLRGGALRPSSAPCRSSRFRPRNEKRILYSSGGAGEAPVALDAVATGPCEARGAGACAITAFLAQGIALVPRMFDNGQWQSLRSTRPTTTSPADKSKVSDVSESVTCSDHAPARIPRLEQRAALVHLRVNVVDRHTVDQLADAVAVRGDSLLVALCAGEHSVEERLRLGVGEVQLWAPSLSRTANLATRHPL